MKMYLVEFKNKTAGYFNKYQIVLLENVKIIHSNCFIYS